MNDETRDEIAQDYAYAREEGKAALRGIIATEGIERAAELVGNTFGEDIHKMFRLEGMVLAAFEAGMSHQIARTR